MKKTYLLLSTLALVFSFNARADALLIDNMDGTVTETRDDGSSLMWLQDANLAGAPTTWTEAFAWADSLVFAGYSDWRLPSSYSRNGSGVCSGYNCADGELGYLYYTELGNPAYGASYLQANNTGPFLNLAGYIWSSTVDPLSMDVFDFNFDYGGQFLSSKTYYDYAIAVRPGPSSSLTSAVPEPGMLLLTGSGIGMMFALRRRI